MFEDKKVIKEDMFEDEKVIQVEISEDEKVIKENAIENNFFFVTYVLKYLKLC